MEKGKDDTPPLAEESLRSTKKVRIRPDGDDGGGSGDLKGKDVAMEDEGAPRMVSYWTKLLNLDRPGGDQQSHEEVVVIEEDYRVRKDGDMPTIDFSKAVRDVLVKGMENTLIIKLLGHSVTYRDFLMRT
ncbi:hypothetical protein QN277_029026 [Acacia crassicarpa]|uniref:Uncharacterized protein n=1 Tax=Acacia crassicarpa TaxID=499986 RepID=A0AAE1J8P8_9FABA|nr:hypothetical protein QN277_029026 [Acacia crassicarpa]